VIVICARPEAVIEEIQEAYSDGAIADLPLKKKQQALPAMASPLVLGD
jgi:hypothetical protein